jgi:DNA-binding transcriptional regulator YhcF (GntR family)
MSAADIDKEVPVPYHYQLRELLRDEIAAGRWEVGERLPSERELCETFNLSRTTVREAIDALVNEGLLRREKGRGTFVAEPKILESLLQTPIGFTDSMLEQGYHVETKVLRIEIVPAPRTVAHELRLRSDEPVTVIYSDLWPQIKADVYQKKVVTFETSEGGILGSAILAGVGAGVYEDPASGVECCLRVAKEFEPRAEWCERYTASFELFKEVHDLLQDPYHKLARIT